MAQGANMAGSWRTGWGVLVHSINVFKAYPSFLLPILTVWSIYAPSVLYLKYGYDSNQYGLEENLGVIFLFLFGLSFLILMSCAVVLEMIRQIEVGNPSLLRAVAKALGKDMIRVFPHSIVWATIWFVLSVIEVILSRKRADSDDNTLTAESAAATIANYREFSFSIAFIEALKKGVRMVMFLIMPAIAWENLGVFAATKKGLSVLRAHLGDFGSAYALTYAAAVIVFLPPFIIFELGKGRHGSPPLIHFPDSVWVGTIIYIGLAWSFCIYLEQMFMAQLYLWHMKWESKVEIAKQEHQPLPEFHSVSCPELLVKTPGLFA
jgi:hypothetical protein